MIDEGIAIGLAITAAMISVPYLLLLGIGKLYRLLKKKDAVLPQASQTQEESTQTGIVEQQQATAEATKPKPKRQPNKQLEVHEGKLLAKGFAKREYGYSSYRLEIQSTHLGVAHEIWGIDLKRALEASGATIGDTIRVVLAGHLDVALNGENNCQKKIFEVTKLE